MGINISTEEVAIFESFGAKQIQDQDATLLSAGIKPKEQDINIRSFLDINGTTAALIKTIAILQIVTITNQYIEAEKLVKNQINELSIKLQEIITDWNTIKNAYGEKKAELILRKTGYYELKAHYMDPDESDCTLSIKNDSDNEIGIEDEPIEMNTNDQNRRSLNNSIHVTKKKVQYMEKQSFHKHILGVNCIASEVTNKELEQMIKEDMIALYELNQTISHTKILLKNVPKHVTKEMLKDTVEAKIRNLPPNTTDQQLEGELLPRHAKHWKVYNINKYKMETLDIKEVTEDNLVDETRMIMEETAEEIVEESTIKYNQIKINKGNTEVKLNARKNDEEQKELEQITNKLKELRIMDHSNDTLTIVTHNELEDQYITITAIHEENVREGKNKNMIIIQVYKPNNDRDSRSKIKKMIKKWINRKDRDKWKIIIMADLNENMDKLEAIFQNNEELEYIWSSGSHKARIDYILANLNLKNRIIEFKLKNSKKFTDSDHKILIVKIMKNKERKTQWEKLRKKQ
ncbi:hypothetical protein C1645_839656 [Glomus cerebriforme]|uniref:Endonuclease/exonuclease/phosphatase domain-containing protein n=1 Tax=Glomus cerebriforme TaxID=658196 RepID=A0A397S592_9GLOM|nr:hypothetical protein C1645_839656 [Glomus cerebriforme]